MNTRTIEVIFYVIVFMAICIGTAPAQTPEEIITATIILEAGGEYSDGAMQAVHEVIANRSAKRKMSMAEVCLQASQFACWKDASLLDQLAKAKRHPRWREAMAITMDIATNYTGGADHYHADYCDPYWNKHMKITAKIGRHIFYK